MYLYILIICFYCNRTAISAEAVPDAEVESDENAAEAIMQDEVRKEIPEYVEVVDPSAPEISFVKSECPQRKVIKIVCDQLGKRNTTK